MWVYRTSRLWGDVMIGCYMVTDYLFVQGFVGPVFKDSHRDRHTQRQTERQTHTYTHTPTQAQEHTNTRTYWGMFVQSEMDTLAILMHTSILIKTRVLSLLR